MAPRVPVSDAELEVLKELWAQGPATVRDVAAALRKRRRRLAYNTVLTLLSRLREKGYVDADRRDTAHLFRAAVTRDELLGSLGGVFHGTVVEVKTDQAFLVADAFWVPPDGDPIGPMALEITCEAIDAGCRLKVRQSGYDPSPRWLRYYAVTARGWQVTLLALKRYAETARAGTGTTASTSSAGSTGPSGSPSPEASSGPSDSAGSPAPTDAATPEVEATVPAGPTAFERLMNSDNSND